MPERMLQHLRERDGNAGLGRVLPELPAWVVGLGVASLLQ